MNNILLINPWIYDFAAYDLWIKPWGLLKISAILKKNGFNVFFVDALDRHHALLKGDTEDHKIGTGKYISEEITKPDAIKDYPRKYRRYGLPVELFNKALPDAPIDAILVSSGMTYWYEGAFEAIRILKDKYKKTPVILGGTYATLSYDHAIKYSGADLVLKNKDLNKLSSILGVDCDFSYQNILDEDIDYSWYDKAPYGVLRLSLGCPFDCTYCAQKELGPEFVLKDKEKAIGEIRSLYERGIKNFAFYDDALLFNNGYIKRFLEDLIEEGISVTLTTPNGLHAKYLSKDIAYLMKKANFVNPVLSLEISKDKKGKKWHQKVTCNDLIRAISNLRAAGYKNGEYTVYLLLGAPGSTLEDVMDSIYLVHSLGAKISLSEFSPVPKTKMSEYFKEALDEPLLQNNSIFPAFDLSEWDKVNRVKKAAHTLNANI